MARPGKKPRPVAERRAKGNPGGRSLVTIVPEPRMGVMMCPIQVAQNSRAKAYWDEYLANAAPGHLAPIDAPILAMLCMCLSRKDEAESAMEGKMLVQLRSAGQKKTDPPKGPIIQSPWMPIVNRQTELARKLAADLALPPAERNRVGGLIGGRPGTNANRSRAGRDKADKYLD